MESVQADGYRFDKRAVINWHLVRQAEQVAKVKT
jgi:hypothetical protein